MRVEGLGFRVWGLGFRVWGSGLGFMGSGVEGFRDIGGLRREGLFLGVVFFGGGSFFLVDFLGFS